MKKTFFALGIGTLIAVSSLSSCQTSAEKVGTAETKVNEANENLADARMELNKAQSDSVSEYYTFKKESELKIAAHEKSIAEFKARIASEKKENRAKYEKKLAELEQKNTDMKKKLEDYKEDGKDKWMAFKTEFTHDMDNLGTALKGFTAKNK
jgi:hypothetical protein